MNNGELTDRQMALLMDLAKLQICGYIHSAHTVLAQNGYDEGSIEVEMPDIVTYKGIKAIDEHIRSGRTLIL